MINYYFRILLLITGLLIYLYTLSLIQTLKIIINDLSTAQNTQSQNNLERSEGQINQVQVPSLPVGTLFEKT